MIAEKEEKKEEEGKINKRNRLTQKKPQTRSCSGDSGDHVCRFFYLRQASKLWIQIVLLETNKKRLEINHVFGLLLSKSDNIRSKRHFLLQY